MEKQQQPRKTSQRIRFRTAANRTCIFSAAQICSNTFESFVNRLAHELGFNPNTLRMFSGSSRLTRVADLLQLLPPPAPPTTTSPTFLRRDEDDIESSEGSVDATATLPTVMVVGVKIPGAKLQQQQATTPPLTPHTTTGLISEGTDGPLKFPHAPGGMQEIFRIIREQPATTDDKHHGGGKTHKASPSQSSALYDALKSHPTILAMGDLLLVQGTPSSTNTVSSDSVVEDVLRALLKQISVVCPPLLAWVRENMELFLALVNRTGNPFAGSDFVNMLYDLQSMMGDVLGALGVDSSTTPATVEVSDGDHVFILETQTGSGNVTVGENDQQEEEDEDSSIMNHHSHLLPPPAVLTIRQFAPLAANAPISSDGSIDAAMAAAAIQEDIRHLENSVTTIDDPLVEATLLRELAITYEGQYRDAVSRGDSNGDLQRFENKTTYYYRKAIGALLRVAQGGADLSNLQTLCMIAPSCYISAQQWFKSRDPMSSLAACIAHLTFWDAVERIQTAESSMYHDPFSGVTIASGGGGTLASGDDDAASVVFSHPGTARASAPSVSSKHTETSTAMSMESAADPFQETMRLMRYTTNHATTLVFYSLLGQDTMLIYVLRNGNDIRIVQTAVVADGFKGSMNFMEEALTRKRFGVNLHLMWTEHLQEMYRSLVKPIEHLLPPRPRELDEADVGQVCFVVSFSPVPLPFLAMIDENGVPVVAKWAVFQAHVPGDLFSAESGDFAYPASTTILSEQIHPSWLTRQLARNLNVTFQKAASPTLILHVDCMDSYSAASLPPCDFFICERFASGLRYQIRRAALVRGMMIHNEDESLPYEFARTMYLGLCDGHSICRSLRTAMLATMRVYPIEPWRWGSLMLFNYGGQLPPLERHVEAVAQAHQKREVTTQRALRSAASTPESRYSDYFAINSLYDAMLHALLEQKPQTQDDIENTLIACLETFPSDFKSTRPSSTTTSIATRSMGSGRMVPAPPEKPPGKPLRPTPASTPVRPASTSGADAELDTPGKGSQDS